MGFNCLKATATLRRHFTFYHSVPRNSWYSFYRPQKDERLSQPWSHPVVLNTGLLDWKSSALTTRPLLHSSQIFVMHLEVYCGLGCHCHLWRWGDWEFVQLPLLGPCGHWYLFPWIWCAHSYFSFKGNKRMYSYTFPIFLYHPLTAFPSPDIH